MNYRSLFFLSVLSSGCLQDLPETAPQFSIAQGISARADSSFCFVEDDLAPDATPTPPFDVRIEPTGCLRFTVLTPAGEPITGDPETSRCSIRPQRATSGLDIEEPLALRLGTVGDAAAIDPNEPVVLSIEQFDNGQLVSRGSSAPFLSEDGSVGNVALLPESGFSCLPPNDADDRTTLQTERAFHTATVVGDPILGEQERIVVTGGLTAISTADAPGSVTDSIEIFDRKTMRFSTSPVKLSTPRVFHDAFAFDAQGGSLDLLLLGGSTKTDGLRFASAPKDAQGNTLQLSPFLLTPPFTPGATGYDDDSGAGAEIVHMSPDSLEILGTETIAGVPGRFGAAVAQVGRTVYLWGGIATTPNQGCAAIGALQNVLCSTGISLTQESDGSYSIQDLPALAVSRVGAKLVVIPSQDKTFLLVIGGNLTGVPAELFVQAADGSISSAPLSLNNINASDFARAFFSISALPQESSRFFVFGGEELVAQPNGRLVKAPGDTATFAGVLEFTTDANGGTLSFTPVAVPAVTRPTEDLLPSVSIPLGGNVVADLRVLDGADEDSSDPTVPDPFTNVGERTFFAEIAASGLGETPQLLIFGGARDQLFPQDNVYSFDPTTNTLTIPSAALGGSLHLMRRAVGLRAVVFPSRNTQPSLTVLMGGLTGLPIPVSDSDFFFVNNFLGDQSTIPQIRKDVSYFHFAQTPTSVVDACDPTAALAFQESAACSFANSSLLR